MKKILLLGALIFGAFAINAQEVSEEQWTLISKKTADWCPLCGSWGWSFNMNLHNEFDDDNVVTWALHYSGDLMTPTAKDISDNFMSSGQPKFFLNTDDMNVLSSNTDEKIEEFKLIVESLNSFEPFAAVGTDAEYYNGNISFTSRANFLVDLEGGNYYLASYLVQKNLIAPQASQGNNANHTSVLLTSLTEDSFGENIVNGAVSSGDDFTISGDIDVSTLSQPYTGDHTDYEVVTVLWTSVGGSYTPFNLNKQDLSLPIASTNDAKKSVDLKAYVGSNGQINVSIDLENAVDFATLKLINIAGNTVVEQPLKLEVGQNQVVLENKNYPSGTYIINITTDNSTTSRKISIK